VRVTPGAGGGHGGTTGSPATGSAGAGPLAQVAPAIETFAARRPRSWPSRPELAVVLVAAAVFSWNVGTPSPWWDEAVTRDVISRPVADIVALAGNVDLVHLTYYLLMHALTGGGAGFVALRVVSVVASALTAGLLVRLGRQLDQPLVGVCAGLLYTVAPMTSRYAQEARSYALVTLAATASTVALLHATRRPWRRARWLCYALLVVGSGLLNLISVLILLPHLVYLSVMVDRPTRRRWAVAAGAALLVLLPFAVGASRQSGQLSWLPPPGLYSLTHFLLSQYAAGLMAVLLVALAVAGLRPRDSDHPATNREALLLGAAWALLPPVALWLVSQVHPLFDWRYVIFCLPGSALAIASLATLLRPVGTAVVVTALAIGGLHMQHVYRRPAIGHAEDLRGAAQFVADGARPGDGVLFLPGDRRVVALAYPDAFRQVDDLALARDPISSRTLYGVESGPTRLAAAMRTISRIWVVTGDPRLGEVSTPTEAEKQRLLASGFRLAGTQQTYKLRVLLYVRVTATGH
jgi:mannosyltransferase